MSGSFEPAHPAEQGEVADGTEYRLWHVQGEFRNDFDLHRFPFDQQTLSLRFFNGRSAADQIVYVLDKRSTGRPDSTSPPTRMAGSGAALAAVPAQGRLGGEMSSLVAAAAFRNLTQWEPEAAGRRRDNLVTASPLGDPRHVGVERSRELSGFLVTIELARRSMTMLAKTLLPLLLTTLIMFASLYFPHPLVKEKVTVAVTGALSGAVLLTAINNQFGSIGYTIALEYAFYVFFCLSLLCMVSVLAAERLRAAGRDAVALATERGTRAAFLLALGLTVLGAWWLATR